MDHILIEKCDNYTVVTADEGYFITKFNASDDNIKTYSASKLMYCPKTLDLSAYYAITDALHQNYINEQVEAMKINDKTN